MKLFIKGTEVPVLFERFPAGETLVRIGETGWSSNYGAVNAVIEFKFKSNDDLINLLLLTDAIRRRWPLPDTSIELYLPYLPYARQDRVCNPGESLSVKVIADLINSQGYSRVTCKDLHSDVSAALIQRLDHIEIFDKKDVTGCAHWIAKFCDNAILVSPDAGSNKKVFNFAKVHGFRDVVRADKIRNVATGEILETKVFSEHVGNRDFLIMDDICDGGRTFVELAKALRPLTTGKIYLYVTHGLFTKGYDELKQHFDRIYTANLMGEPNDLVATI